MLQTIHQRKVVHFFGNHDNSAAFIIGGIGLSLLALLSFGLNRVLHALKGRKDATVPRYNSRALVCGPTGGVALAPASEASRTKRQERRKTSGNGSDAEDESDIPIHTAKRRITVTGVFKVRGRIQRPAVDDQLVYLDE